MGHRIKNMKSAWKVGFQHRRIVGRSLTRMVFLEPGLTKQDQLIKSIISIV